MRNRLASGFENTPGSNVITGTQISTALPGSTPKNLSEATPTIWNGLPLRVSDCPTTLGFAVEMTPPVVEAQDGTPRNARGAIVITREEPAHRGRDAKHLECLSRNELLPCPDDGRRRIRALHLGLIGGTEGHQVR